MSIRNRVNLKRSVVALGAVAMMASATALPLAAAQSGDTPVQLASCSPCKAKGCNPVRRQGV